MAYSIQVPTDILNNIALQIGDRIAEEFSSSASAVPPAPVGGVEQPLDFSPLAGVDRATARFKLAETFELWKFRENAASDLAHTREDLVTLTRATGAYRHQVRLVRDGAKTAVAFAESYATGQNERSVRDFFFSPLAAELDSAIELADKLIPEEAVTRLLSLPEFKVEALWFVTISAAPVPASETATGTQTSRTIKTLSVIVVSAPPSFPEKALSLLDSSTFIQALSVTSRGMGLLL